MKAIILAAVVSVAVAVTVTLVFRRAPPDARANVMVKIFLAFIPLLVVGWAGTPDDLGFLPRALLAHPPWFDLAACLFFYTAAFGGGLLQLYNLAERGFSLRILAELHAACGCPKTLDEIAERYSDGRGLAWMYDKRVDGLVQNGLVVIQEAQVMLTERGRRWADRFARLRQFLRLPAP